MLPCFYATQSSARLAPPGVCTHMSSQSLAQYKDVQGHRSPSPQYVGQSHLLYPFLARGLSHNSKQCSGLVCLVQHLQRDLFVSQVFESCSLAWKHCSVPGLLGSGCIWDIWDSPVHTSYWTLFCPNNFQLWRNNNPSHSISYQFTQELWNMLKFY